MEQRKSRFRECFIPDPGKVLVIADLSQIEPRLTAHYAAKLFPGREQECPLLKSFSRGLDLYATLANEVLEMGLPEEKLTKSAFKKEYGDKRDLGKVIQLATTYGLGPKKLGWKLSKVLKRDVGYKESKGYIDSYWQKFWDVHALRQATYQEVLDHGYVDTLFGRKVYLSKSLARQKSLNYKIQPSASDYCTFSQFWVQREASRYNVPHQLLLLVHDEVIYQVPRECASDFKTILETVMVYGWKKYHPEMSLVVPLEIEAGVGESWAAKG